MIKEDLQAALTAAYMELANFGQIGRAEPSLPECEMEVTSFIRARTRLYRHTWIIGPLKNVIVSLYGEKEFQEMIKNYKESELFSRNQKATEMED